MYLAYLFQADLPTQYIYLQNRNKLQLGVFVDRTYFIFEKKTLFRQHLNTSSPEMNQDTVQSSPIRNTLFSPRKLLILSFYSVLQSH